MKHQEVIDRAARVFVDDAAEKFSDYWKRVGAARKKFRILLVFLIISILAPPAVYLSHGMAEGEVGSYIFISVPAVLISMFTISCWIGIRKEKKPELIKRVGIRYLKIKKMNILNKSIMLDTSGFLKTKKIEYPQHGGLSRIDPHLKELERDSRDLPLLQQTEESLIIDTDVMEAPFSGSYKVYDREARIERELDSIQNTVEDYENISIDLPILTDRKLISELRDNNVDDPPEELTVNKYDDAELKGHVNSLAGMVGVSDSQTSLAEYLRRTREMVSKYCSQITEARHETMEEIVKSMLDSFNYSLNFSSYNFYCPNCHQDSMNEIKKRCYEVSQSNFHEPVRMLKNAQVRYNPESGTWRCPLCETSTDSPIPVHKIIDEAIFPTYDYLIKEHHRERLNVYNDIKDKMLDYRNNTERDIRKLHTEFKRDSAEAERELRKIRANISMESQSVQSLKDTVERFTRRHESRLDEIDRYAQEKELKIREESRVFMEEYSAFVNSSLDSMNQKLDKYAELQRIEDSRRDDMLRRTVTAVERSADANERTAGATARTAAASERTAAASEDSVKSLNKISKANETTAACLRAQAKKRGETKAPAWNIAGRIADAGKGFAEKFNPASDIDRERGK